MHLTTDSASERPQIKIPEVTEKQGGNCLLCLIVNSNKLFSKPSNYYLVTCHQVWISHCFHNISAKFVNNACFDANPHQFHWIHAQLNQICLRPHLHVPGYPCKRILLKTFTQNIYTKTPKTYSECGYFVNGYLSGYSINAYIDRFRVNKL